MNDHNTFIKNGLTVMMVLLLVAGGVALLSYREEISFTVEQRYWEACRTYYYKKTRFIPKDDGTIITKRETITRCYQINRGTELEAIEYKDCLHQPQDWSSDTIKYLVVGRVWESSKRRLVEIDLVDWDRFAPNQPITVEINAFGRVVFIK